MTRPVVLFDALETLGSEIAASRTRRFDGFELYPSAPRLLEELRQRARIGVFSLDPEIPEDRLRQEMSAPGLRPLVDPDLVAVARPGEESPFAPLLDASELEGDRVVFVSLDAGQRARALDAGLRVAPHPALAGAVLEGQSLHLVRLSSPDRADWADLLDGLDALPLLPTHEGEPTLYAVASQEALDALRGKASDLDVEALGPPDLVARTTLVLLQVPLDQTAQDDELRAFLRRLEQSDLPFLQETPQGLLVAWPADRPPEELHPPPAWASHGHTRILLPSPAALRDPRRRTRFRARDLEDRERKIVESLDEDAIESCLRRSLGSIRPDETKRSST